MEAIYSAWIFGAPGTGKTTIIEGFLYGLADELMSNGLLETRRGLVASYANVNRIDNELAWVSALRAPKNPWNLSFVTCDSMAFLWFQVSNFRHHKDDEEERLYQTILDSIAKNPAKLLEPSTIMALNRCLHQMGGTAEVMLSLLNGKSGHLKSLSSRIQYDVVIIDECQDAQLPHLVILCWALANDKIKRVLFLGDTAQQLYEESICPFPDEPVEGAGLCRSIIFSELYRVLAPKFRQLGHEDASGEKAHTPSLERRNLDRLFISYRQSQQLLDQMTTAYAEFVRRQKSTGMSDIEHDSLFPSGKGKSRLKLGWAGYQRDGNALRSDEGCVFLRNPSYCRSPVLETLCPEESQLLKTVYENSTVILGPDNIFTSRSAAIKAVVRGLNYIQELAGSTFNPCILSLYDPSFVDFVWNVLPLAFSGQSDLSQISDDHLRFLRSLGFRPGVALYMSLVNGQLQNTLSGYLECKLSLREGGLEHDSIPLHRMLKKLACLHKDYIRHNVPNFTGIPHYNALWVWLTRICDSDDLHLKKTLLTNNILSSEGIRNLWEMKCHPNLYIDLSQHPRQLVYSTIYKAKGLTINEPIIGIMNRHLTEPYTLKGTRARFNRQSHALDYTLLSRSRRGGVFLC